MLNKLLKYDLKYMIKNMSAFYILSIFFALLIRVFSLFNTTTIIQIILTVFRGTLIALIINILINTVIRSWVRFRDSIYKDEAYLTHTLPVSKSDIYNSKFIQTLIFYFIGFIIILLDLFIAFYSKTNMEIIKTIINSITVNLSVSTFVFIFFMLVVIFLEVFNAIQCGFLGIICGYKKNNAKVVYSILFGFIAYLVSQSIVLFLTFIEGVFDKNILELFKSNMVLNGSSFKMLFLLATIFYILIIFVMSIICKKLLKKGVNIE